MCSRATEVPVIYQEGCRETQQRLHGNERYLPAALKRTARGQRPELLACLVTRQAQVVSEFSHTGRLLLRSRAKERSASFPLAYDLLVTRWDPVQPYHVRQATAEYDRLGQDEFLARHHFGPATAYLLILDDKRYDSKAILGVAYQYATGRPLGQHDFSGGVHGAAGVLRSLGFEIANIRDRGPAT
jgi:hypothetical protein